MLNNKNLGAAAVLAFCLVAIFAPDLEPSTSRSLAVKEEAKPVRKLNDLVDDLPPKPEGVGIKECPNKGEELVRVDWSKVEVSGTEKEQKLELPSGHVMKMTISETAPGQAAEWGRDDNGYLFLIGGTTSDETDLIESEKVDDSLEYPAGYATMELEFDRDLEGLYISVSDVDSNKNNANAVRIRMFDDDGDFVKTDIIGTGSIVVKDNYGFESKANVQASNPGFEAAIYATAQDAVRKVALDQSVFIFNTGRIDKFNKRTMYPALDFAYCAVPAKPPAAPTPAPDKMTDAPVAKVEKTPAPVAVKTDAPVTKIDPTRPPVDDGGVNGDPLIMGLSGQLFKFEGRSGAWYSAVSTPSFQWNMKVQKYEKCPAHSDNFISGVGFSYFDNQGQSERQIQISVVNPYEVKTGCGGGIKSCLGGGSLEIVLDGVKIVTGGDYKFNNGAGRILAFNTFYDCARRWYDFDVSPGAGNSEEQRSLRSHVKRDVYNIIENLEDTMTDKKSCKKWIKNRKHNGDLFEQAGLYSTILIITPEVNLHVEYKQEHERCEAHTVNVWISHVSNQLYYENWEGVIGETKDPDYRGKDGKKSLNREEALKHPRDESYEVNGPFADQCDGCIPHR